jgi:hypothetical protein
MHLAQEILLMLILFHILTSVLKYIITSLQECVFCPGYSGGRDQEGQGSKSAWADSSREPISKIPNTKKGCRSGSSGRVPT